ncbi:hypothetical protein HKD37_01G001902 [Glycine soja]
MQDKIDCNNINEIREERNTNSIYTGSATSSVYVQSSSNPLEIFHSLCKILLQSLNHTGTTLPLCSGILTT